MFTAEHTAMNSKYLQYVKTPSSETASVAGCLNDLVWRNKYMRKETKSNNIQDKRTPDNDKYTTNKRRNLKSRQILEANEMKVLRQIVGKTKIDRIRSQQIRESCGIQPINEWVERRRQLDEHVTRMDSERLVKISRDNIPVGRRSPGRPKRRWSDLIIY